MNAVLRRQSQHLLYLDTDAIPDAESNSDLSLADDAALAQALIDGSTDAPVIIWRRFAPLVRRILVRSLGPARNIEGD